MAPKNRYTKTLIMKFGGASLRSIEQFQSVAEIVAGKRKPYDNLVVVVSAMYKMTDRLMSLAGAVSSDPPKRETDMLLTVGERVSMALLAMVFSDMGLDAVSFTGSQAGIVTSCDHTDAIIKDVRPQRIQDALKLGKLIIVAGFQGVSTKGEITTLGRGGSDTTAVALGVALKAEKVEFYKGVKGIFESDPNVDPNAQHLPTLKYREALEVVCRGEHEVLHHRAILLAEKNRLPLHVLPYAMSGNEKGSLIVSDKKERISECFYEASLEKANL